jgi:hypothetical protein
VIAAAVVEIPARGFVGLALLALLLAAAARTRLTRSGPDSRENPA